MPGELRQCGCKATSGNCRDNIGCPNARWLRSVPAVRITGWTQEGMPVAAGLAATTWQHVVTDADEEGLTG